MSRCSPLSRILWRSGAHAPRRQEAPTRPATAPHRRRPARSLRALHTLPRPRSAGAATAALLSWTPLNGAAVLERALGDALRGVAVPGRVRRLELTRFRLGAALPRLLTARLYDVGPDTIAFDVEVVCEGRWNHRTSPASSCSSGG